MRTVFILLMLSNALFAMAQPQPKQQGPMVQTDTWTVEVNEMDDEIRQNISRVASDVYNNERNIQSIAGSALNLMLTGSVSALVDVVTTEIFNIAKYNKQRKQEWRRMIENESNYTDSISSIRGLKDFYSEPSLYGALDPSHINFDGITVRGVREGKEFMYMSCHIDRDRLDEIFSHSKFYLVLDSLSFFPYACHLPNVSANGIRLMKQHQLERDNSFSFSERGNLNVGIDMEFTSSWFNEAIMLMQDVRLGGFKMNVKIPDNTIVYTYSRRQIEQNRESGASADTAFIQIEGGCFVVPRSYMPLSNNQSQWGTGEYNVKVRFRESCKFNSDASVNEKQKHWRRDYRQLRKMQQHGNRAQEYLRTIWQQQGNTLVRTVVKQVFTDGIEEATGLTLGASATAVRGGSNASATATGTAGSVGAGMPSGSMKP